jgi:hypothetical protein
LLIIKVAPVENYCVLQYGFNLFFDFLFSQHSISSGNLPSDADEVDYLVFICFGLTPGVNFQWNFQTNICNVLFAIFVLHIENI